MHVILWYVGRMRTYTITETKRGFDTVWTLTTVWVGGKNEEVFSSKQEAEDEKSARERHDAEARQ